jgi:hypothetical protein
MTAEMVAFAQQSSRRPLPGLRRTDRPKTRRVRLRGGVRQRRRLRGPSSRQRHRRIVPAGDGWTVDPFGGIVRDEKLFDRCGPFSIAVSLSRSRPRSARRNSRDSRQHRRPRCRFPLRDEGSEDGSSRADRREIASGRHVRRRSRRAGANPPLIASPGTYDQKHVMRLGHVDQCIA